MMNPFYRVEMRTTVTIDGWCATRFPVPYSGWRFLSDVQGSKATHVPAFAYEFIRAVRNIVWCFLHDRDSTEPWKKWKVEKSVTNELLFSEGVYRDWLEIDRRWRQRTLELKAKQWAADHWAAYDERMAQS